MLPVSSSSSEVVRPPALLVPNAGGRGHITYLGPVEEASALIEKRSILATVNAMGFIFGRKQAEALDLYLKSNNFSLGPLIGFGGSSRVFKLNSANSVPLAIKIIKMNERVITYSPKRGEVLNMNLRHPNILSSLAILCYRNGIVTERGMPGDRLIAILMPKVDGCCLQDKCGEKMLLGDVAKIGIQLCEALIYLHQHQIIHADLNLKNVLIRSDGVAVLTDFGNARKKKHLPSSSSPIGTEQYSSPQRLYGREKYCPADDAYSLGVLLCRAYFQKLPDEMNETVFAQPEELKEALFVECILALANPVARDRITIAVGKAVLTQVLRLCQKQERNESKANSDASSDTN